MADIRVERSRGGKTWLWVLLAVIAIIAVVVLLDYLGYITLPVRLGAGAPQQALLAQLALMVTAAEQEE
jgi:hypothetical protein